MRKTLLSIIGATCALTAAIAQCGNLGTGVDGAYAPSSSTTLPGGTYNYTSVTIPAGVVITVTGTSPLVIYCQGTATIDGSLILNGSNGTNGITSNSAGIGGMGVAGGGNGGDGTYSASTGPLAGIAGTGPGGMNNQGDAWSGGGGAGYAAAGASSGNSGGGFGGPSYGTVQISGVDAGSGGGGGSGGYSCGGGGGGGGGGYLLISANVLSIGVTGVIQANGGNGGTDGTGNCGGGGGGSGGSIFLSAQTMTHNGSITATGGIGGASNVPGNPYYGTGANGADGRVRLDYNGVLTGAGTSSPAVGFHATISTLQTAAQVTSNVSCFGGSDGSAIATNMNGNPPYTQMWSPSGGNTTVATGLTAGTYTYTVTDNSGCTASATVIVTEPPMLQIAAAATPATCFGSCDGTATANVSGGTPGYTYLWLPGNNTTASVNGLCAGCYTVVVTDANGCTATQVVCVTQPSQLPGGFLGSDSVICTTDVIQVCAPNNFATYMWNTGATTMCINVDTLGCYSVVAIDTNGCQASDTICVTETPCVGIEEISSGSFGMYPNPASGSLTITHGMNEMQLVQITDVRGSLVFSKKVANNEQINISHLAEGVYTVNINGTAKRLVVTR